MGILKIDGILLRKMIIEGANELNKYKQAVDALNVFPVPDGDTGTNMSLTVLAAAKEVQKMSTPNISDIAKAAASGSLRGARGNSGVILSQLFRGFSKGLEGKAVADADDLASALTKAMETAYKAVLKPKEGTMLTISKAVASRFSEYAYDIEDIEQILKLTINYANEVLNKTTQMLPELKQAGVVDAGGKGILLILDGAYKSIHTPGDAEIIEEKDIAREDGAPAPAATFNADIKFAYCTEFFINLEKPDDSVEESLKNYLQFVGDSIVVVSDETLVKVHVHTNHPGIVLEKALQMGYLSSLKIENMVLQHTSMISFADISVDIPEPEPVEMKEIGFVAVSMGSGIKELFESLGVDEVIEGGQTMNPSTEEILQAVERVNAENVIVLPNNKNIIWAAQQACELSQEKAVHVIPSKSVPQGLSAIIAYLEDVPLDENIAHMTESMANVKTGLVTYAVRATTHDGNEITEGDILCMNDGSIVHVDKDLQQGTKALVDILMKDGGEVFSIFYGAEVNQEMADDIRDYVQDGYPTCELEVYNGAQPLYYYILSVE